MNGVYVVGGFDGENRLKACERYDEASDSWELIAEMITPRSNFGIEVLDGSVIVMGGFDGDSTISSCEFYSGADNQW